MDRLIEQDKLVLVHPYDDPDIVRGQGTIGLEILEDTTDLDDIIVPIGGGGLMSGIAIAIKEARPDVRLIGVQSRCTARRAACDTSPYETAAGIVSRTPAQQSFM